MELIALRWTLSHLRMRGSSSTAKRYVLPILAPLYAPGAVALNERLQALSFVGLISELCAELAVRGNLWERQVSPGSSARTGLKNPTCLGRAPPQADTGARV